MSDLRKAAQQALEALEAGPDVDPIFAGETEAAIRAALAQQPEPVCKCDLRTRLVGDGCEVCNPELAAELAQQPEPAQEPDFHGFMRADGTQVDLCFTPSVPRSDGTYATAYYTAPPKRPPLTDEEIKECLPPDAVRLPPGWAQFARAVERKVRGE